MLEMKTECEKCHAATPKKGEARICSFECTFCPDCAAAMSDTSPNCGGELQVRPKRMLEG
jgi:hypothetical protein